MYGSNELVGIMGIAVAPVGIGCAILFSKRLLPRLIARATARSEASARQAATTRDEELTVEAR